MQWPSGVSKVSFFRRTLTYCRYIFLLYATVSPYSKGKCQSHYFTIVLYNLQNKTLNTFLKIVNTVQFNFYTFNLRLKVIFKYKKWITFTIQPSHSKKFVSSILFFLFNLFQSYYERVPNYLCSRRELLA